MNGTFIGAVGILHSSHQVQARVLSDGRLEVTANGVALAPDHKVALGDASVELDPLGTSLEYRSELCIWKIAGVAPYTWKDIFNKAHIDMQVSQEGMSKAVCLACPACSCSPACLQSCHHGQLHVLRRHPFCLCCVHSTHSLFAKQQAVVVSSHPTLL